MCDGMILGSLIIGLNALHILEPPEPPYHNISIKGLFQDLLELKIPRHYTSQRRNDYDFSPRKTCEGVSGPLKAKIDVIKHQLQGLSLTDEYNSEQAV